MKPISIATGIPTEPDVKRLSDKYPSPKPGVLMTYDELAETIHESKTSHRFRSVLYAWRKRLFTEQNIFLKPVTGKGLEAATGSDRIHISGSRYKSGLRKVARASDVAVRTNDDGLTPDEKKVRNHLVTVSASIRLAAITGSRRLRYPEPGK